MSDQQPPEEPEQSSEYEVLPTSRRRFLSVAGAAGLLAGAGGLAYGSQQTAYEFGGEVAGWQGQSPDEIADETNPTLELQAGTEYEITWENLDGQPHDFVIRDENGEELVGTDVFSEEGETHSFTFTASEEMAEYICTVHPTSMVGDIEVSAGAGGTPTEDGTPTGDGETPAGADGFVPEGPSVGVEQVADGPLVNPVTLRSVPGEENTYVLVDQPGQVYVHGEDGLEDEPVLDIADRVLMEPEERDGFDERGFLGLDFHPNFEETGQFYVRYSAAEPAGDGLVGPGDREFPDDFDHIEVLSVFETDGDQEFTSVDPDSEEVILEVPSPQFNHNGGEVVFGPDGYLYTTIGDGGNAHDIGLGHVEDWYDENEGGNAQNVEANLLGKVLRIDVGAAGETTGTATGTETATAPPTDGEGTATTAGGDLPYEIPSDNPFVGTSGYDEIYAYGLRNPWRMSFDGDTLIAADVGQALFEEVDVIENGGNYGWNVKEGFHCFSPETPTEVPAECPDSEPDEAPYDGSEFVDPVLEYPHQYQNQSVGISITGGYVYDGDAISELSGQYVFGDWSASFVEPQGRLFAAMPSETAADGEETTTGTATPAETTATETPTESPTATPTADGTATETASEGAGENTEPDVEVTPPDEQPWQWSELVVEGGENGELNRYVQAFGRDADGDVYVLASRTGRLLQEAGEVFRLVPAGEGEEVEVPDIEVPEGDDEETDTPEDSGETPGTETPTDTPE
ncbi:PQQ-dependent sugar dehydrogenase [Halosimplex halophilum]|uniref:PQQ-dependent sugar dehydrogenase n=1 Tax=Halosimplex halophilum TaxID=2559572 RepID=UPI00107F0B35|nr:PQQ-dependent sugar dehydrogenase [Halosimplex halophilum]